MNQLAHAVSIHPYFRVHAGQMNAAKAILSEFVAITSPENGCLYYDFSINGDVVFCREAYLDAQALLDHVASISETLHRFGQITDLFRLEVHGPAAELAKLKDPFEDLEPEYFVRECGVER